MKIIILIKNKIISNLFTFFIFFVFMYIAFSWVESNEIWSNIFISLFTSLVVTIALHFGFKKTLKRINPNLDKKKNGK